MLDSLLGTWQNLRKKPRFWILLFFLVISSLILIIPALKSKPDRQANTWEVIVQTFFATVLTASLIELSVTTSENYLKESNQRQFRQLFSCDFDTDKSVAIVLPAFNIQPEQSADISEDRILNANESRQQVEKELAEARSFSAQWVDVIIASNLASAFSSSGLPVPRIIRDNEAIEEIENKNTSIKTFISIGLFSNKLTLKINERNNSDQQPERYFKIQKKKEKTGEALSNLIIRLGNFEEKTLISEDSWSEDSVIWDASQIKPIGDNEYVLFAKTYLREEKKTVIVLGGCLRDGTEIGGKFLSDHLINSPWKKILKKLFDKETSMEKINNRLFAVVYRIPLENNNGEIKAKKPLFERSCISPEEIS